MRDAVEPAPRGPVPAGGRAQTLALEALAVDEQAALA